MNGALLVRFSILIAAEIFFFDALNLFDRLDLSTNADALRRNRVRQRHRFPGRSFTLPAKGRSPKAGNTFWESPSSCDCSPCFSSRVTMLFAINGKKKSKAPFFSYVRVLGRTALWLAVACGTLDARSHYRSSAGGVDHARGAEESVGCSDLIALSKSSGKSASKFFHSPVRGCWKPNLQAWSICRGKVLPCLPPYTLSPRTGWPR